MRFVGRSMLASYFIVNGARSLGTPEAQVRATEPMTDQFVPLAQSVMPDAVTLPTEARSWVRIGGAAQIAGGVLFATGWMRRLGASILTLTMIPQVVSTAPKSLKDLNLRDAATGDFVKNVALAGATCLASKDLEGSPSLAWRAQDQAERMARAASNAGKKVGKKADDFGSQVDRKTRKARRQAKKNLKKAERKAKKQIKDLTN